MPVFENLKNFIRHGKQGQGLPLSSTADLNPISHSKSLPIEVKVDMTTAHGQNHHLYQQQARQQAQQEPQQAQQQAQASPMYVNQTQADASVALQQQAQQHEQQATQQVNQQTPLTSVNKAHAFDQAAVEELVAQENEARLKMPTYKGLEGYRLLEKMGDGAFSEVFKAYEIKSNQHVALKIIRKQDLNVSQHDRRLAANAKKEESVDQRATILKEVTIMRQLKHNNIVSLLDFQETQDFYFIVLELIPGGELFHQIVRLTYFSEDLSRHVILQVAEAVKYLHEVAGVVHRDIKPENLLFYPSEYIPSSVKKIRKGEDQNKVDEGVFVPGYGAGGIGVIKLADFGLSKVIWDSKTMTPCGTVGYTAPEIVKDERYSKSVDMWALGCVLYTILCGFPPFYDESIDVLTAKVAKGQYTFLSPWWDEISDGAKDLVSHLLTVDPEKRYTIEEFLAHPWITHGYIPTKESLDALAKMQTNTNSASAQNYIYATTPKIMTPAAATLKEVFDVSNAVYRMEQDNRRNKRFAKQPFDSLEEEDDEDGSGDIPGGAATGGSGSSIEQMRKDMERVTMKNTRAPQESSNTVNARRRKRQNHDAAGGMGFFELNLDGATLLERRRRGGDQAGVTMAIPS